MGEKPGSGVVTEVVEQFWKLSRICFWPTTGIDLSYCLLWLTEIFGKRSYSELGGKQVRGNDRPVKYCFGKWFQFSFVISIWESGFTGKCKKTEKVGWQVGNTEELGMFWQFSISFLWVITGTNLEFNLHLKVWETERAAKGKIFGCFLNELSLGYLRFYFWLKSTQREKNRGGGMWQVILTTEEFGMFW